MNTILETTEWAAWSLSDAPRETVNISHGIIDTAESIHKLIIAHSATNALDTQEKLERDITIAARKLNKKLEELLAKGDEDA